jgi:ABC-type transport system involved in cytochrome bd biosynthesis fused ATPase/permease subunit
MNSVERIVYYSQDIEQEAPYETSSQKPLLPGQLMDGLNSRTSLSYRSGLATVLKGITVSVNAGEKIRIVGRTGGWREFYNDRWVFRRGLKSFP